MPVTRRDWLALAARAGTFGVVAHTTPIASLLAQGLKPGVAPGKEKLLVRSLRPPDYETPVALLDSWITPIEHFYVRSHMPAPAGLDAATWTLSVDGEVNTAGAMTLDDLRKLPPATVTVTLECAGNGRSFFDPPVAGIQWGKGAVGTARWTGARLADVLKRAGVKSTGRFVVMNGADRPLGTMPDFLRQMPLEKALHPDTILAYEMNGQPIPQLHGFPLRVIVPGWEGAYSVKWLTSLRVVDRESDSFWVATAYRYPTKRVAPGAAVDPRDMAPLTGLVVKSLITRPLDGTALAPGRIDVAGFAWAGETDIARVDVSTDYGASWQPARLASEQAKYAWRRFEFSFDATREESYLVARDRHQRPFAAADAAVESIRLFVERAGFGTHRGQELSAGTALVTALAIAVLMPATQAQELAAGPGRETVTTRCLSCHESDLIVQQRLSRAAWGRSVDKMIGWGAVVEPAEREPMLDYLAAHFAPTPAASHLVATAGSEVIYKRTCLTCHEDDLIESQRLTRAGWVREVEKMMRWGADVPATDKDALVDYLAARYPPR